MELLVADLFCGAGGAARGIELACQDAGIAVTIIGVDNRPQPRYPYHFILGEWDSLDLEGFDFVWASPPCQSYSITRTLHKRTHAALIEPVRDMVMNLPHVIENVVGAPLLKPHQLCGSSFNLNVQRHRLFECSFPLISLACNHYDGFKPLEVVGHFAGRNGKTIKRHRKPADLAEASEAMGIDWMSSSEIVQAIPPAYSRYIFSQWLLHEGHPQP
jgi:DNA (cytosine-5)-methyltransferase 1